MHGFIDKLYQPVITVHLFYIYYKMIAIEFIWKLKNNFFVRLRYYYRYHRKSKRSRVKPQTNDIEVIELL